MRAQRIARVFRSRNIGKDNIKEAISALTESQRLMNNGKNWVQEVYKEQGKFCAIGAVKEVWSEQHNVASAALVLAVPGFNRTPDENQSLANFNDYEESAVFDFNDHVGREFKSIKRLFDRAKTGLKLSLKKEKR